MTAITHEIDRVRRSGGPLVVRRPTEGRHAELAARLAATGAVVIDGPRGCGKTETARKAAASEVPRRR